MRVVNAPAPHNNVCGAIMMYEAKINPTSGNLQGENIISDKEIKSDNHNNQQFSQKQALIGAFNELRERGFNVIPIIYGEKKPAIKWTQYQTKLVTHKQCKEWEGKRFNVGIVTGAISNIFVLDVDGVKYQLLLKKSLYSLFVFLLTRFSFWINL